MHHKHTVILYHGKCPDGFGAAFAAWKKFGDEAEYIPVKHGDPVPEKMEGREVYLTDFCYPRAEMDSLKAVAQSVTVLDHHEGVREVAESFPGVFDSNRSGATIAWSYFHSGIPVPRLLARLEDGDLYRYSSPETRDVFSLIEVYPREFEKWNELVSDFETPEGREHILSKARTYTEYFELMGSVAASGGKLVSFEGYECYFAACHPSTTMKSYVANQLYTKRPPIALTVTAHTDGFGVSIRSDGSVDVAKIAQKFGGNGHPGSAGFFIPNGTEMPWKRIEE